MRIAAPAGTVDSLPEKVRTNRYVEAVFMDKCRLFGYSEIHTPVFEYGGLFEKGVGKVTDIVEKELYSFSDRSGVKLALRPEGTTSVTRAVLQHNLYRSLPAKLCYKITCYRQEDPEEGRLREFHQIGAECYGSSEPKADAEVIALAWHSLSAMGVENLSLNINSVGCEHCRVSFVNELARYLLPFANRGELCSTCVRRLGKNPVRVLDCKNPLCKAVKSGAPKVVDYLCPDCQEHYGEVKRLLTAMNIPFNEKPGLLRGLDYYHRTVFEFKAGSGGASGTVGGGGRFDPLSRRIGGDVEIPAVGFAIGEERVVIAMSDGGSRLTARERPTVWVVADDSAASAQSLLELRNAGLYAEGDIMGLAFEEQLSRAAESGAEWQLVIKDGSCVLKNISTGEKKTVKNAAKAAEMIISEKGPAF